MESAHFTLLLRLLQIEAVAYLAVLLVIRNKPQKIWLKRVLYGITLAILITIGMLFYSTGSLEAIKNEP